MLFRSAMAREAGVAQVRTAQSLEQALAAVGQTEGTVLITGSLYLAGQVLKANDEIPD